MGVSIGQVPQLPLQPLLPQTFPVHDGVQLQVPELLQMAAVPSEEQVPQLPPQPSLPQFLPTQLGVHEHWPVAELQTAFG